MKHKQPAMLRKRFIPNHQLNLKRIMLLLVLVFPIVFSINNVCIKVSASDMPVHNINTGMNYPTIQEAIDAPETTDGHTILVDDGTYYEHITIYKTIKLLGTNQNTTIIDGNGTGQVVSLTANASEIAGFTVQNGEWGIDLTEIQNASVTENKMFNCSYGGKVNGCSRCTVANNTATSNTQAGIYLWESERNLITNNTIASAYHGIWLLSQSTNNIISNNFVINNSQGIVSSINCNNNTLMGNTVTSSSAGGIVMGGAFNNTIFHNNLLQNTKQAWSYGDSSNFWDDGTEGNFWKDYLEPDPDEDGIGETPYTIDEKNQDNHPLMGMFNDFNIAWEEENHHVYVISNSTISDFDFKVTYEPEIRKAIIFNVSGEDGAVGFCRVMVPTALINGSYTVIVDGKTVDTTVLEISNTTHAYLYFTYSISTKQVLIIPEHASPLILLLLLIYTTFVIASSKKKR